ncbi:proline racemase family protein [Kordiimonas sp. SCSIO 12603]|uniref:proline racemase family protein n=1 Tax=Kordiimonas sp. SCSIO 12603 TaxID=2829596 RepID=UPI002101F5F9|nr:proline racemase family protein [Kordiimonas sp. SCSIO 12603]UTW60310.1 proline racemase family protein [Kordiimonas sp. SCSIO 12603]
MRVIDSHTGGEPTRVIIEGGPDLGHNSMAERRKLFAREFDDFRTKSIREPRSSDAAVGALLCEPVDPKNTAGVIFFNTAGFLGMCGHGTIGLINTLAYLGKISEGIHDIETPVGVVQAELLSDNKVRLENIASYRFRKNVTVRVPEIGDVTGDIAWGGNWFFLVQDSPVELITDNIIDLTYKSLCVRRALAANNITGKNGAEIDHIEFFAPSKLDGVNSKNFVMCPGGAYDRSPCGTGTSAKVACLADDGKLNEGESWLQESIVGSVFEASYRKNSAGEIIPSITGSAYICGETRLIFDENDPFHLGMP